MKPSNLIPKSDEDPITIAHWIKRTNFPLTKDEFETIENILKKKYDGSSSFSIGECQSLQMIYYEVIGWLRKK